jgi:glycosyltransferase involved in cell wall biosynthesis
MSIQTPIVIANKFESKTDFLLPNNSENKDNQDAFIFIVVPCYNEANRLNSDEFKLALDSNPQLHFLFVDDGSTDKTLTLLDDLQAYSPERIFFLSQEKNSGKAEAVRQGLLFATASGAELVGYWDADLATPLCDIRDFSKILFKYHDVDVVYGSRIQLLGHKINRTFARRTVSRICSTLARLAVGLPVKDTQCGAKMLRNTLELRNNLHQEFTAGWLFDVELFARLSSSISNHEKAFYEYPLAEWNEIDGSNITTKTIVKSGFKMLKLVVQKQLKQPKLSKQKAIKIKHYKVVV